MKKIIMSMTLILACISGYSQIKVLSTGALRLGNTSAGHLIYDYTGYNGGGPVLYPSSTGCSLYLGKSNSYFVGVYSGNFYTMSDGNFKENIQDITNALQTVKAMKGVKFDYNAKMYNNDKSLQSKLGKNKVGFIAQDLQKVLPQAVSYDDSTGIYAVDYTKVIPVLVEAIKEQQKVIDQLVGKSNEKASSKKESANTDIASANAVIASLGQNVPNPFNQSTVIVYYLPETVQNAMLNVYDMNGLQIKTFGHLQTGKGSITVHAAELRPGMYLYSLIADGKEIDTKRMILTE